MWIECGGIWKHQNNAKNVRAFRVLKLAIIRKKTVQLQTTNTLRVFERRRLSRTVGLNASSLRTNKTQMFLKVASLLEDKCTHFS